MAYTWSSSNTLAGRAGHPKFLPSISSPGRRLLEMKLELGRREAPSWAVRVRIRSSVNVAKSEIDGSYEPSLLLASGPRSMVPTLLRVRWWLRSRFTQMSVDQFFHELDAFELHKLHIPVGAAVQRHADLPWP